MPTEAGRSSRRGATGISPTGPPGSGFARRWTRACWWRRRPERARPASSSSGSWRCSRPARRRSTAWLRSPSRARPRASSSCACVRSSIGRARWRPSPRDGRTSSTRWRTSKRRGSAPSTRSAPRSCGGCRWPPASIRRSPSCPKKKRRRFIALPSSSGSNVGWVPLLTRCVERSFTWPSRRWPGTRSSIACARRAGGCATGGISQHRGRGRTTTARRCSKRSSAVSSGSPDGPG